MATIAPHVTYTYRPLNATIMIGVGSTATIWRHPNRPGVVIKSPVEGWWDSHESEPRDPVVQLKFRTEMQVLEILGEHTRIVPYLGTLDPSEPSGDLLFKEAINGDLQGYLNTDGDSISTTQRLKWCKEVAGGLSYCHRMGVLHCDLRPDNLLLDGDLCVQLCDFGGSECGKVSGGGLPDHGFFDPRDEDIFTITESTEVFGLGAIMYTIMTGHRPYGPASFEKPGEQLAYCDEWERLVHSGKFPDTTDMHCGDIIQDCWTKKILSAKDALIRLVALEREG